MEVNPPKNTVTVSGYGVDMHCVIPQEAILQAFFHPNMGVPQLILGRHYVGVGDYYGAFDGQMIFDANVPEG